MVAAREPLTEEYVVGAIVTHDAGTARADRPAVVRDHVSAPVDVRARSDCGDPPSRRCSLVRGAHQGPGAQTFAAERAQPKGTAKRKEVALPVREVWGGGGHEVCLWWRWARGENSPKCLELCRREGLVEAASERL